MTTEKDVDEGTSPEHSAEDLAAFEASFNGTADKESSSTAAADAANAAASAEAAIASTDAPAAEAKPEPEIEANPTDAAPTAPSPKADDDTKAEFRKLHGRIGDLNDRLQQALKTKEAEGKPAVLTPLELKRTLADFGPELAGVLQEDLAEAIANLRQPAAATAPAVDPNLVVRQAIAEERAAQVADAHPTWAKDLWSEKDVRTPVYEAWLKTMPAADAEAFEKSERPAQVIKKLNEFYAWRDKAAKAQTEKQSRLKAAVTPQGTPRAGPAAMSDEDAEKKAFEDAFNS